MRKVAFVFVVLLIFNGYAINYVNTAPDVWNKIVDISTLTGNNNIYDSTNAKIAVDDSGYVHVVWVENNHIYYSCLDGSGGFVQTKIQVDDNNNECASPDIATYKSTAYIVWQEKFGNTWEIRLRTYDRLLKNFTNISIPFGINYFGSGGNNTDNLNSINPKISVDSSVIALAWLESSHDATQTDRDIYCAWYDLATNTLLGNENVTQDTVDEDDFDIVVKNGVIHIIYLKAYIDGMTPVWHVYYAKRILVGSNLSSNAWLQQPIFTDGLCSSPSITADFNGVYLTWIRQDVVDPSLMFASLTASVYEDMVLLTPAKKIVSLNRAEIASSVVSTDGKIVYVVYSDKKADSEKVSVYYTKSFDFGKTFIEPVSITDDIDWTLYPFRPDFKAANGNLYVTWEGGTTTNFKTDIFIRFSKVKIKEASVPFMGNDVDYNISEITIIFSKRMSWENLKNNIFLIGDGKKLDIEVLAKDLDALNSVQTVALEIKDKLLPSTTYQILLNKFVTDIWGDSIVSNIAGEGVYDNEGNYVWPFTTRSDSNISATVRALTSVVSYPNPAYSDDMKIYYVLNSDVKTIKISIYNRRRKLVKEIKVDNNEYLSKGSHEFSLVLDDKKGRKLPNGIYFIKITAFNDNFKSVARQKIVILRQY